MNFLFDDFARGRFDTDKEDIYPWLRSENLDIGCAL